MAIYFKTTEGRYTDNAGMNCDADDPTPPDGDGRWVMVAMAAANGRLFWSWTLELTDPQEA
jgi:hypothetical protein